MTTASSFLNEVLAEYTPPGTYFDAARGHRTSIEHRLDDSFGVREIFETGSLKHGTGVWLHSDVDYIVCLKGERPQTGTSALTKVKNSLADRFQNTIIKSRNPAVVCEFDGGKETVEVVPAYEATSGYWIPDPSDGGWMLAHPKNHNAYVNEVNAKHNGGAKKLARLGKIWKYMRSVPVSSCYMEMRAAKYADGELNWWMPQDLYTYLKGLQDIELAAMNDPTGLGSRFTAYSSDTSRDDALSKLATAVTRAQKACQFDKDDKDEDAVTQLKLMFNL